MFGAIPGTAAVRSLNRRGPSISASATSSVQRSPTRARAASSGDAPATGAGGIGSSSVVWVLACHMQATGGRVDEAVRAGATLAEVARRSGPSVAGLGAGWGTGCAIVVADGLVLASARGARGGEVVVSFADGRRERAEVLGVDEDAGLAALAVATGAAAPLPWSPEAGTVGIGTPVIA